MTVRVKLSFVPQFGPQSAYVKSPYDITVYGGARGGGKTFGSLGEFFIHAEDYGVHARGLMIRRSREDLKDCIATAMQMYGNAAKYMEKGAFFRFHNGARLYMAYLENDQDAQNYQGWSLTRVYVEELTQFPVPEPLFKLLATLRSSVGIHCRFNATCNPGGPGHHWVKAWIIDKGAYQPFTDPDTGLVRVFIQAKLTDNPALMQADPQYVNKLRAVGSPQLVKAWLDGNWDIVEGAFFTEYSPTRHVIEPFPIPPEWIRFRAMDWGSAKPFSVGWYAVVQDPLLRGAIWLPRGAIIRYREYYGAERNKPNVGLKLPAESVAQNIVTIETIGGKREVLHYGVLDPSAFAVISGPSIAETLVRNGVVFRRADNARRSTDKRMGGWDQVRMRLKGNDQGEPMIFFFSSSYHMLRTLPMAQHDMHNPEDMDTEGEDHALDELRYACLSRPFRATVVNAEDLNPLRVANAFRLNELD